MKTKNLSPEMKTLFIPLYGKAEMSKQGVIISDKKAEEIINKIEINPARVDTSKSLAMYMAMRAKTIDDYVNSFIKQFPDSIVINLGCGLDSRVLRIKNSPKMWYDLDFPEVIKIRHDFFKETEKYSMIGSSVTDFSWMKKINHKNEMILIVAEGLTMYLTPKEMESLTVNIKNAFHGCRLIFDAYSNFAVRMSKYKNPINKVNAKVYFGIKNPHDIEKYSSEIKFIKSIPIVNKAWSHHLNFFEKLKFNLLYSGKFAQSLHRIFIYEFLN